MKQNNSMAGTNVDSFQACTGIRLMAADKGVVYGRTNEWGAFDMHSRVAVIPRGYSFAGLTPDGLNGRKWKAKYGVVGIDADGKDYLSDGMNKKGLAIGLFYLPGFTCYPGFKKNRTADSITAIDVTAFILTQFATIDEVRRGMSKVRVVPVVEEEILINYFTPPGGRARMLSLGRLSTYMNPSGTSPVIS